MQNEKFTTTETMLMIQLMECSIERGMFKKKAETKYYFAKYLNYSQGGFLDRFLDKLIGEKILIQDGINERNFPKFFIDKKTLKRLIEEHPLIKEYWEKIKSKDVII